MNKTFFLIPLLTISILLSLTNCGGGSSNREPRVVEDSLTVAPTPVIKPIVVNVFIDNSVSMRGYVPTLGARAFTDIVHDYLAGIERAANALNIWFISETPFDTIPSSATAQNIRDYLRPARFGGNDSDMAAMLERALPTAPNEVSIFITDGIFSPGGASRRYADQYLRDQQIRIRETMIGRLSRLPNTAVAVYQFYSLFYGRIWNAMPSYAWARNVERPFYIWLIGDAENVYRIKSGTADSFNRAIENVFTLFPSVEKEVNYTILMNPRLGHFEQDRRRGVPQPSIRRMRAQRGGGAHAGRFMFTTGVDFSPFDAMIQSGYLTNDYLTNVENYVLRISNQPTALFDMVIANSPATDNTHTHHISLTTERITTGELQISLQRKRTQVPQWVFDITDSDGRALNDNTRRQTFGLKYMVRGVHEAFQEHGDAIYTTIKLNLNR